MKKILLAAVCLVSLSAQLNAQTSDLVLTRPDMSYPGASFNFAEDTSFAVPATMNQGGKNQVWDFSNAQTNYSFVTRFLAPDANNGGNQVTDCDLVIQHDDNYDEFNYMNESNTELWYLRSSEDTMSANLGQHRAVIFPLEYGLSWSDSSGEVMTYSGADFGVPFDSIKIDVKIMVISNCDASGWLKLPLDSAEVLRVKQEFNVEYTVTGYTDLTGWFPIQGDNVTTTTYSFYSQGGGYAAASLSPDEDDPSKGELLHRSQSLLGVKKVAASNPTLVYPNPSHGSVFIQADKAGQLTILDLQGKVVKGNTAIQSGINSFDAADLINGTYLVFISYNDGTQSVSRLVKK